MRVFIILFIILIKFSIVGGQNIYHAVYHVTFIEKQQSPPENIPPELWQKHLKSIKTGYRMDVWLKNDTLVHSGRVAYNDTSVYDLSQQSFVLVDVKNQFIYGCKPKSKKYIKRPFGESEKYIVDSVGVTFMTNKVNSAINKMINRRVWYKPVDFTIDPGVSQGISGVVLKAEFPNEQFILEKLEEINTFYIPDLSKMKEVSKDKY